MKQLWASMSDQDSTSSNGQDLKVLALESMSHLASQFSRDPDLQGLLDTLALTLSGQFATTNVHIAVKNPASDDRATLQSGTGRFKTGNFDIVSDQVDQVLSVLGCDTASISIDDLTSPDSPCGLFTIWKDNDVRLVAPLRVGSPLIGILLIGKRFNNVPFSQEDRQLLDALLATICPLLSNSFLYAQMADLNAWYVGILDSVPQAIFVIDPAGKLRKANRAGRELVFSFAPQLSGSNLVGLPTEDIFPETTCSGWSEQLKDLPGDGQHRLPTALVAHRGNSDHVYAVRKSSLVHPGTSQCETILTLQDITEQRNNEARMFDLEKFAERGIMASSISHDLNNHLGIILGGIEIAQMSYNKGNHEKVITTLTKLKDSVGRMERFTSGLMDYARMNVQKQPDCFNDVVTDVLAFAMAQKRFGRIRVFPYLGRNIPTIEMDRDQIAQLVINLLNNAADAIAETERPDGAISVKTFADNGYVCLSISDNGQGMRTEIKDRLFKSHLTTKPKGHGYGLVNCARILENHGGLVDIQSELQRGTVFTFRFPIVRDVPAEQANS